MNVIIARQNFFSPSYLLILFKVQFSSEYVLKQKFKPKYARMLKIISFLLKIVKIAQRAPRPPVTPAAGRVYPQTPH